MATCVLLFDGQGSHPSSSAAPFQLPRTPLAALFVQQARASYTARVFELSSTSPESLDSRATHALLKKLCDGNIILPVSDATLLRHPLIALPSLYVTQVVRLFEELETNGTIGQATSVKLLGYSSGILPALLVATSFPCPLRAPASLTAFTQTTILRNALALFDVAVSIGIEAQISKECMFQASGVTLDDPMREQEWSAVVLGEEREALKARLASWNSQRKAALFQVHLTAQTSSTCHTVSGLPFALREFLGGTSSSFRPSITTSAKHTSVPSSSSSLSAINPAHSTFNCLSCESSKTSPSASINSVFPSASRGPFDHQTSNHSLSSRTNLPPPFSQSSPTPAGPSASKRLGIFSLFHAPVPQLRHARDQVLARYRCLPSNQSSPNDDETVTAALESLRIKDGYSLYDVRNGCLVPSTADGCELIRLVVDSILVERIEFLDVIKSLASGISCDREVRIVNFSFSTSLARATLRSLKEYVSTPFELRHAFICESSDTKAKRKTADVVNDSQEPIAIVGMAVNFPGAQNAGELWHLLEQGLNTVQEIPDSRFSVSSYTAATPNSNPGRQMRTRFGNFLPDNLHASFDNAFFRISPREARTMDPQMRVLMRVGLQAIEDSGIVVQDLAGNDDDLDEGVIRSEDVGCFVGAATNDYVQNLRNDIGVHYATGTLSAFLAGRLAYALHLSGPSIVMDTACSSSLVAIHQACRALLAGDCKAALAGGVNIISSPDLYIGLDRAHFLSPTGNCRPWDAAADGYCRAEGCGLFVLKRLSHALASSDNILGLIRGSEINQSAAATSITRPHGPTQAALFRKLLDKTGVLPEEVSLVEAHGTGTQAGDPEELKSLRDVLSPRHGSTRDASNVLTLSSIKGNVGHAEAASGAASLAKVLLMLRHRCIPTQVGLDNLNPRIVPLERDFTRINTSGSCIRWDPAPTGRRIALVNNFGAAGSNAAILVEEAPSRVLEETLLSCAKTLTDHVAVCLSAETEDAAIRLRDSYIASVNDLNLVDFAYTATARRKLRPWRIAVTADSVHSLSDSLSKERPRHVTDTGKKVVFVFSGQGGQYLGMGRQLYTVSAFFRAIIDDCHEKLVNWGYPGILAVIDSVGTSRSCEEDEIVSYQCAMFVLECALCSLWKRWGVEPSAVIGHSLGEYAALVAAGVLSLDNGLRLVARRARLMVENCRSNATGMLLIRLPGQRVSEVIAKLEGCQMLAIACLNGPSDVVVGGPLEQLELLKEHVELSGSKCISINVPFAYHTAAMDPLLEDLSAFSRKFDVLTPSIPIVSNVTGDLVHPGDSTVFNNDYFSKHCRQTVRFEEGVRNLVGAIGNDAVFVEVGPHPTALPTIGRVASTKGALLLHSCHKKATPRSTLLSALSRMYMHRDDIAWGRVYRDLYPSATCIKIPGYPLMEKKYWVPYEEFSLSPRDIAFEDSLKRFSFLKSWTQKPSSKDGNISEFETPIEHLVEYITGHNVASSPLCPASVYHELALSAASCTLKHLDESFLDAITLSEVQFTLPLVYDASKPIVIRTTINLHPKGSKNAGTFSISSVLDGKEQNIHCTGFFQHRQKILLESKLQLHRGTVERGKSGLLSPDNGISRETLRTRTIYELIFSRVVKYSKIYQVINAMTLDERDGEGFATFRLTTDQASKASVAEMIFIDALLHAAGFLINSRAAGHEAFICNQVDASKLLSEIDYSADFEVYCATTAAGDGLMLADAWAIQSGDPGKVVAHMKRMRFSRVRLSSLTRHLTRADDIPSRNSTPAPFLRSSIERFASPVTPARLGSPFCPAYRAITPSSASVSTQGHVGFDIPSQVLRLVAELCGISASSITFNSNAADLGIDSLVWIELVGQMKQTFPDLSVDISDLITSTSLGELISKVVSAHHRSSFKVSAGKEISETHIPSSDFASQLKDRTVVSVSHSPLICSSTNNLIIRGIFGNILDIAPDTLGDEDDLEALGLDSLGSVEALSRLREQFGVPLPHDFLDECSTVATVQTAMASIINQTSHSRQSSSSTLVEPEPLQNLFGSERSLLPFQTSQSGAAPLFLVHDGSGLSHCYSRIGDINRPVWGISNPKLLSGENWKGGIPEMAAHYAELVKPRLTDKGCLLGGWSFGGVVAFHMACELIKSGVKVAGVVLIDSPSPFTQNPLPEELIDSVISLPCPANSNKQQERLAQLSRFQMSHATKALVSYEPSSELSPSDYPKVVMLRCADAFSLNHLRDKSSLPWMPFFEDRINAKSSVTGWEMLLGQEIPVFDIPGHHFEPFSLKNVSTLTRQLKKAITYIDTAN